MGKTASIEQGWCFDAGVATPLFQKPLRKERSHEVKKSTASLLVNSKGGKRVEIGSIEEIQ